MLKLLQRCKPVGLVSYPKTPHEENKFQYILNRKHYLGIKRQKFQFSIKAPGIIMHIKKMDVKNWVICDRYSLEVRRSVLFFQNYH
jgi:hypothetical protein